MRILILLAVVALVWWRPGHADTYTCFTDTGRVLFKKNISYLAAWPCAEYLEQGLATSMTLRHDYKDVDGNPKRYDTKLYSATGAGVWYWEAPKIGLPNLDHYNMYRQVAPAVPTLFAQIDGRTQKLLLPMAATDFGACFWFQSVDKTGKENPQQSNKICLDPDGLPLPVL